ncbi:DNA-binding protein [Rhodovibrio salinarum]|nr:DNA-binding protein [Rhodovibrio salinarum]
MQYATLDSVRNAVADLTAEGIRPSIPQIRLRLGGGSHTTILRCLRELREEALPSENEEANSDTRDLPKAISTGLDCVDSALQRLEDGIRQTLTEELAAEQRRLQEAHQSEIEHLKKRISDAWSRCEEASHETQDLCDDLDATQAELERVRHERDRLRSDHNQLAASLAQLRDDLKCVEQEHDRIAADRDAAKEGADAARAASERADQECARALAARDTAIAERDAATGSLDDTRADLRQTAARLAGATATVEARDTALASCREECEQLRSRCAELEVSIQRSEAARGNAEGRLSALQDAYAADRAAWQRERQEFLAQLRPSRKSGSSKSSTPSSDT